MEEILSMVERLDVDTATNVMRFLDEPADLVRFSGASRSCQKIVVESRRARDLCIRICPEVSMFNYVMIEHEIYLNGGSSSSKDSEWEGLKREHRIYARLGQELMESPAERSCIVGPIYASSTDNYPQESIFNTLNPSERKGVRPSYWSSKGEENIKIPETLTYALQSNLCVVHEVKIRPFQAFFHRGAPIYSANAVRFRFGYPRVQSGSNISALDTFVSSDQSDSEDYAWTYVSQDFSMLQANELQTFKFPRPVLCIGGIFQVELLGRVQKCEIDGLHYFCMCHVHVVGRPLSFIRSQVLCQQRQFILVFRD